MASLKGMGIVVTRAAHQSAELVTLLTDLGARAHVLPMLRYEPKIAKEEAEVIEELGGYDWIAFTSANAVEFFTQALERLGVYVDALNECKLASIGAATTRALEGLGLSIALESSTSTAPALAKELGNAGHVLLPRSQLADGELPDTLRAQGCTVTELVVYDTVSENRNGEELAQLIERNEVRAILFASPSAVDATLEALGKGGEDRLTRLDVFSIGPKTTARLAQCQIGLAAEAKNHNSKGLVTALEAFYARKP